MKYSTFSLVAAATFLIISTPVAQGGQFHVDIDTGGYGRVFRGSFGGVEVTVGGRSSRHDSCHVLHTVEVHRRTERRRIYNDRGRSRTCRVTVVTYQDYYSNGSTRTYTRTYH